MRTTAEFDPTAPDAPLWAFDHDLYAQGAPSEWSANLRAAWARSPGRRVYDAHGDLAAVKGELSADLTALHRAAGVYDLPDGEQGFAEWFSRHHPEWQALHATIPGACLARWRPAD